MKKSILYVAAIIALSLITISSACNSGAASAGKTIVSGPAGNNLTATISSADGTMKNGEQEFTLTFTDANGKAIDVGKVAYTNQMAAMGSMAEMNNSATFTTPSPGVYKGKINVEMAGDWKAQIAYEGPAGKGSFTLPITTK